jgi:hypothetical protein
MQSKFSCGDTVFGDSKFGVEGIDFNELNAPYGAKVVGDKTGLTAPI